VSFEFFLSLCLSLFVCVWLMWESAAAAGMVEVSLFGGGVRGGVIYALAVVVVLDDAGDVCCVVICR